MALIDAKSLVANLSPPLDHLLAEQLVAEFTSAERRFIQRDWEPSELDGGQFAEIAARILYHTDSGNLALAKGLDDCLRYIENEQVSHLMVPRSDALHIARVLRTLYKFRSQRGAVHISPSYQPNHMDARLVIECVRWLMNEFLRIYWNSDREAVARAIRELLQFDVPAVGVFDTKIIVQRTDLTAEEEILVLLHYSGEIGFSRNELGRSVQFAPSTITKALQHLVSPGCRQVIQLPNGNFRLTDLGSKRVRESLADRLVL